MRNGKKNKSFFSFRFVLSVFTILKKRIYSEFCTLKFKNITKTTSVRSFMSVQALLFIVSHLFSRNIFRQYAPSKFSALYYLFNI